MCKYCKKGLQVRNIGVQQVDIKSKVLGLNRKLSIGIDILQNEDGETFCDGGFISAWFDTDGFLGLEDDYIFSKPIEISYCPFCGEKLTKKDF